MKKIHFLILFALAFSPFVDAYASMNVVEEDCHEFATRAVEYEAEVLGFESYREVAGAYIEWYELCEG